MSGAPYMYYAQWMNKGKFINDKLKNEAVIQKTNTPNISKTEDKTTQVE